MLLAMEAHAWPPSKSHAVCCLSLLQQFYLSCDMSTEALSLLIIRLVTIMVSYLSNER